MVSGVPLISDWVTIHQPRPRSTEWMHSDIAVLQSGRLVYGAVGGGALVIHDDRTGDPESIPLPISAAHGIVVDVKDAIETLWIADPGPEGATGQVLEVGLDGRILSSVEPPDRAVREGWRPTAVVPAPDGTLWIADGYGGSVLYRVMPDGDVQVIDSAGGLAFDCPHGLAVDSRGPAHTIAVADRGNRRIVFMRLDGTLDRIVTDERLRAPSCLALLGEELLVTELLGAIFLFDRADRAKVRAGAVLEGPPPGWPNRVVGGETVAPVLIDGALNSPHGVATTELGDVYVTEWLYGGRVERIRLPE
jgi:DNA-binding beta-propeller fold protein YncE